MATISSVTGTLTQGSTASINGTGFGASQGTSVLLFGTVAGAVIVLTPVSWTATLIQAPIPANADLPTSATSYLIVVPAGSDGVRSPSFQVLPTIPTPGQYAPGTYVLARPGASSVDGGH